MAQALEVNHVDEVADQIAFLLKAKPPRSLGEAWDLLRAGFDAMHARPVRGPQRSLQGGDRAARPGRDVQLRSHRAARPEMLGRRTAGPFVTLPTVYTQDPDTGERNIGMYRIANLRRTHHGGCNWQLHKVAARHGKRYYETGKRMPVAVCLGGDRSCHSAPWRRCRTDSTKFSSPDSCAKNRCHWSSAKRSISKSRPIPDFRHRGLHRSDRIAPRGMPLRRSHRLLHAHRRLSGVSCHRNHAPPRCHLSGHDCRQAADGGPLHGPGQRAPLPARLQNEFPGDRRHGRCPPRASSTISSSSASGNSTRIRPTRSCTAFGAWGR